ncbi:MAG: cobalamin biosynthesis protein CbiG, partial [Rhodospirillales bacterium]
FETGWRAPDRQAGIVLAELYPTPLTDPPPPGEPKDSGQVRGAARRLAERDFSGNLESLFDPPAGTDIETIRAVTAEEGWILGAPFDWVT